MPLVGRRITTFFVRGDVISEFTKNEATSAALLLWEWDRKGIGFRLRLKAKRSDGERLEVDEWKRE